jgi:hypothetical protein
VTAPTEQTLGTDYFSRRHPLRGLATTVALRARRRMFRMMLSSFPPTPAQTVVDVGVTPDRYLRDSNFFERWYPFRERITATSVEDARFIEEDFPGVRFVRTEGSRLPFSDCAFDFGFCSAVLEHVGSRDNQRAFIAELFRVCDTVFVTTPSRWFPVEVHTFLPLMHWLPSERHRSVLRWLGKSFWADEANLNLLSARELVSLVPEGWSCRVRRYRTLGWTSNIILEGRRTLGLPQ